MRAISLTGLWLLDRVFAQDHRGFFERVYCDAELEGVLGRKRIRQINRSFTSRRGTVRGMHYQHPPHTEVKLISCLRGEVFDVAIDLRLGSPTFLRWHGELISAENHRTMLVPGGFAHGFQTLTDDCELLYLHSEVFSSDSEDAVNAQDPLVGIAWPLPITEQSIRDCSHRMLTSGFAGVSV